MMSVFTETFDSRSFFSRLLGFRRDNYAERQLVERQEESHRLANDPQALADLSVQSIRRHDNLTIAELEAAKETARAETEMFCAEIDRMIQAFQDRSGPLVEAIHNHTHNMTSVREMLTRYRGG
jgi:murein L,D-transpeptidase YcbB/YkuD